jgi:hypothetical protein
MPKYQKPIRHVREEIYDYDLTCQQREELEQAYADFWETLHPELATELDMLLL